MKTVVCLFCGERSPRGKEHVFADTLLQALEAGQRTIEIEKRSVEDNTLEDARKHTFDSFRCGGICTRCNNTWMSELENAVKPWILSIASKPDLLTLQDPARKLTFSRWALKTACIIDHISAMNEIGFDIAQQLLKPEGVPAHVSVLVGYHEFPFRVFFRLNQRNRWTEYPLNHSCESPDCKKEGPWFKVAFGIERLMVAVAGVPSDHYKLVIGGGVHVPIWPVTKIELYHRPYSMRIETGDPVTCLQNFSDLLAVSHAGRMW
jgi:hypothetical protein